MARLRRRTENQDYLLYDSDTSRGWRFNRRIGLKEGERLELAGHALRVYDEGTGEHVGWQKTDRRAESSDRREESSDPTLDLMSAWEMTLVAGLHGPSQTAHMSRNDPRRLIRVTITGKLLPPEDDQELAVAKLHALTPRHLQMAASARM